MKAILILVVACLFYTARSQQPQLVLPIGHPDYITDATFSNDGRFIAATSGRIAKIWSTSSKKEMFTLKGHRNDVRSVGFSADGKLVATSSKDSTIKIWNTTNGLLIKTLKGHTRPVLSAEMSSDNKHILSIGEDSTMRIWDVNTGKTIRVLKDIPSAITSASYNRKGDKIIAVYKDKMIRLWDAATGKLLHQWEGDVSDIHLSPDEKFFMGTFRLGALVSIRDMNGNWVKGIRKAHDLWMSSAAFSYDGEKIITASSDSTVKIWNAENCELLDVFKANASCANAVFSRDGKHILATVNNTIHVWNLDTKNDHYVLKGRTHAYENAAYSNDGKLIVTASSDGIVNIWSVAQGKIVATLQKEFAKINGASFSPDGKKILVYCDKEPSSLWDAATGSLIKIYDETYPAKNIAFSPDGKNILLNYGTFKDSIDRTPVVINTEDGKILHRLKGHRDFLWQGTYSPDGQYIATASWDKTCKIWNAADGTLIRTLPHAEMVSAVHYSDDGKQMITTVLNKTCSIWDAATGEKIKDFSFAENRWASPIEAIFNHDGSAIIMRYLTRIMFVEENDPAALVEIRDAKDGKPRFTLKGHTGQVLSLSLMKNADVLLTASRDNICKTWNLDSGKETSTFFSTDKDDHFIIIPGGYYYATPGVTKLLYYNTPDGRNISFEQLDVKYNRPDLVLKTLKSTDTLLINSYERAYYKRIKKLGADTTQLNIATLPEADFTERSNISYEQKSNKVLLKISSSDKLLPLRSFNLWVNDVPVFGMKGIDLSARKIKRFDTSISIFLSDGENQVETSVTNIAATESYRMPLNLKYSPAAVTTAKMHFVGIGINEYAESQMNLSWSVKDIRDLATRFKEKYPAAIIDTLFNEKVTRSNVLLLKEKFSYLNENDVLVVAFSGHGLLSKELDYYLSTYDIRFDHPEEKGLSYDELEMLFDGIRPRKKLVLIDACHSGELDKDDIEKIDAAKVKLDSLGTSTKTTITIKPKNRMGINNSFELMQSLFVNVSRGTGATIISAAGGMQYAQERGDLKNGVFTYCILDAFNKHETLTISQLKNIVSENVSKLTNGLQKPTSRNETNNVDWTIW